MQLLLELVKLAYRIRQNKTEAAIATFVKIASGLYYSSIAFSHSPYPEIPMDSNPVGLPQPFPKYFGADNRVKTLPILWHTLGNCNINFNVFKVALENKDYSTEVDGMVKELLVCPKRSVNQQINIKDYGILTRRDWDTLKQMLESIRQQYLPKGQYNPGKYNEEKENWLTDYVCSNLYINLTLIRELNNLEDIKDYPKVMQSLTQSAYGNPNLEARPLANVFLKMNGLFVKYLGEYLDQIESEATKSHEKKLEKIMDIVVEYFNINSLTSVGLIARAELTKSNRIYNSIFQETFITTLQGKADQIPTHFFGGNRLIVNLRDLISKLQPLINES